MLPILVVIQYLVGRPFHEIQQGCQHHGLFNSCHGKTTSPTQATDAQQACVDYMNNDRTCQSLREQAAGKQIPSYLQGQQGPAGQVNTLKYASTRTSPDALLWMGKDSLHGVLGHSPVVRYTA